MRRTVQALLLAAVTCVAMLGFASSASAQTGGDDEPRFRALIFGKTAAFRHTECIPSATVAIAQMAVRNNFEVDATENAAEFTADNLDQYDVVIFLCTTGDVLNAAQQTAFEGYIRGGGGYVGIHSASDTEYNWPFYGGLVGAYFRDHPGVAGVNQQYQQATVLVEDRGTAATEDLPRRWVREDEWYNFRTNPRDDVHVLMSLDESTYDPRGYSAPGGSAPMGDHPISWCQRYEGGRSFYTGLGHRGVYWKEPLLLSHVLGGIEMAAGVADFDCGRRSGEELRRLVRQITRDCSRDNDLDREYPLRALRRALRDLPDDVAEETRCVRVIERAIRRQERGRDREVARVLRDCSRDDDLDRRHSRRALRRALRVMPDDVREYTGCEEAIRDALRPRR
jgi:type 1 glutamine amidotransferase